MNRSNPQRQPPSPPMSNNGDLGFDGNGSAHLNPYTPPRSIGPIPHEHFYGHDMDQSSYPDLDMRPQLSAYSPQVISSRKTGRRPIPMGTEPILTRNGTRLGAASTYKNSHRSGQGRKGGVRSGYKRGGDVLPGPLSEITKAYGVPVRDMEAWVNRSVEQRMKETAAKDGHVARPMNSFMLYRSAYAERVKQYCRENNHQVVSKVTGQSWPLEPKEVRDLYTRLADLERDNHQAAHPTYKFTPNKNGKKRVREEDLDSDSDAEWGSRKQTKRLRSAKSRERYSKSPTPFDTQAGRYSVIHPSPPPHHSSYRAHNPKASATFEFNPQSMYEVQRQASTVPVLSNAEEAGYQLASPGYTIFDVDHGVTGMPDGSDCLLDDMSYLPGYPTGSERHIDPSLEQSDGNYTYGHFGETDDTYWFPDSVSHGSYPPPTAFYHTDAFHPGTSLLTGAVDEWYDAQGPTSDFDGDYEAF